MAMTFDYEGCISAAAELEQASSKLRTILEKELDATMNNVKNAYQSDSASEIYAAYDKVKQNFEPFVNSVLGCGKYLRDEVAPAYAKQEKALADKVL